MTILSQMTDSVTSIFKSSSIAKVQKTNGQTTDWHCDYTTVIGFFRQSIARTNPVSFDVMKENFGLIDQDYDTDKLLPANGKDLTQWQRFAFKLKVMNDRAPEDVTFRLLYLGRHGEGVHNVASRYYGSEAWDEYFSQLSSDPKDASIVWHDAHLTRLGRHQAMLSSQFWNTQITTQQTPSPESHYVSPLTRAISTCELTFLPLTFSRPSSHTSQSAFNPIVKESLRESIGVFTCNARSSKSTLQTTFPNVIFEDKFTEHDELFSTTHVEPDNVHVHRMRLLLDDIFLNDPSTYISMTSHHGTITATLRAVGHRPFTLATAGWIPVLVRVKKVPGPRLDVIKGEKWVPMPKYTGDPEKAGLAGYRDLSEYLAESERNLGIVEKSENEAGDEQRTGRGVPLSEKALGKRRAGQTIA